MEDQWLSSVIQYETRDGTMTFEKVIELLQKLRVPIDYTHLRYTFKAKNHHRSGVIDAEEFTSIYKAFIYRSELVEIFSKYAVRQRFLPPAKLAEFLRKELSEYSSTEETAATLIGQYEVIADAVRGNFLSYEGFARFMMSQSISIFQKQHRAVYQDMTLPLCHYFISTSHNTYLIADQLVGQSHLWGYGSALMKGCRCIEIDCWDGPEGDPVVFHGYTFTSKLPFQTVIYVIEKYAFMVSHYPLILSLEDHCSPKQQVLMAFYMKHILGDKLLTCPIGDSTSRELPSPEDLKFKILIKNKKAELVQNFAVNAEPVQGTSYGGNTSNVKGGQSPRGQLTDPSVDHWVREENRHKKSKKSDQPKENKDKKIAVAMDLSDLVVYTKSQKFISFEHSRGHQKFYENNSLSESHALKLARQSPREFIHHTKSFITRIYPKGLRAASSNFNPQEFWNVGAQMVALNFQTPGIPMDLQDGKFQDNAGCGYVLKPAFLRDGGITFNPYDLPGEFKPVIFSIRVILCTMRNEPAPTHELMSTNGSSNRKPEISEIISGFQLPPSSLSTGNMADPVVSVEIYGVPADQTKRQTQVIKGNAFNPRWNKTLTFKVRVPELALVRFCVEDQISVITNEFLGQYTLPFTSMNKGYRNVPLLNKNGQSLSPASLFVHVWYY